MVERERPSERWSNAEFPTQFAREIFPPIGITRLLPHHFKWWRTPYCTHRRWWFWWCKSCCCCCCQSAAPAPTPVAGCMIDLQLEPNVFGPGRSIHIVAAPGVYFAEFYLQWTATGGQGQTTVDVELISGPVATPQLLVDDRGPSDHYLFSTRTPGSYLFRATATDSQGNTCFDTLQVDIPAI
jgi:hypothetical protein